MAIIMTDLGPVRLPEAPSADGGAPEWWDPDLYGDWETASPAFRQQVQAAYNQRKAAADRATRAADGGDATKAQVRAMVKAGRMSAQDAVAYLVEQLGMSPQGAAIEIGVVAGGGGGGARGRDPGLQAKTEAETEAVRARMQREIEDAAFRREVDTRNFGVSEEQRGIDNAYRDARFKYEQAKAAQDFGEAQRQFDKMQQLREAAQALNERKVTSDIALGESADRRGNLGINLQRNEQAGYVVDAEGTGLAAGTLTAAEQERRFNRNRTIAQDAIGLGEREQERRQRGLAFEAELLSRQQSRQDADLDREQRRREFEVGLQTQVASRDKPRIFTPGLVMSRAGAY